MRDNKLYNTILSDPKLQEVIKNPSLLKKEEYSVGVHELSKSELKILRSCLKENSQSDKQSLTEQSQQRW